MPNNTKKECKKCNEGKMHLCTAHYPYFTKKECKACGQNLPMHQLPSKISEDGTITNEYHYPVDKNKKEDMLWCDRQGNSKGDECKCVCHQTDYDLPKDFPSPQSPLSEEKCICGRKKHEWICKPYVDSVVSPSSNENWEIEFDAMFDWAEQIKQKELDRWIMMYGFIPNDLKEFIRQQRLGAQRELTEEIINYMEDGLDEPTDWYVSVKNFLSSRGLLPKITE